MGRALTLTPKLHTMGGASCGSAEGLLLEGPPESASAIRLVRPARRQAKRKAGCVGRWAFSEVGAGLKAPTRRRSWAMHGLILQGLPRFLVVGNMDPNGCRETCSVKSGRSTIGAAAAQYSPYRRGQFSRNFMQRGPISKASRPRTHKFGASFRSGAGSKPRTGPAFEPPARAGRGLAVQPPSPQPGSLRGAADVDAHVLETSHGLAGGSPAHRARLKHLKRDPYSCPGPCLSCPPSNAARSEYRLNRGIELELVGRELRPPRRRQCQFELASLSPSALMTQVSISTNETLHLLTLEDCATPSCRPPASGRLRLATNYCDRPPTSGGLLLVASF